MQRRRSFLLITAFLVLVIFFVSFSQGTAYNPLGSLTAGQLVLAYWGGIPRIGKILSCDQSSATIQFLQDGHETMPPSGYYSSTASIYPLTRSQADTINWISTWYYKMSIFPKYPDTFDGLGSFFGKFRSIDFALQTKCLRLFPSIGLVRMCA